MTSGQGTGGSPLDNLTYDLVSVLYQKGKALEAYDKYLQDAQGNQQATNLLQQLRQQDQQTVRQLQQLLGQTLSSGGSSR